MRTLLLGVWVAMLPFACSSDDDDSSSTNPSGGMTSTGGMSSGGTAGKSSGGSPSSGAGGDSADEGGGAGGDPTGSSDGGDAEPLEDCQAICATEAELPCPPAPDECVEAICGTVELLPPWCVGGYNEYLACLAIQPVAGFYCEDEEPFAKEETCAGELAAFVSSCNSGG